MLQAFASANTPIFKDGKHLERDHYVRDSNQHLTRRGLAGLEKRATTIPNLVPTTTVNLKTDSIGTQTVSPARNTQTMSTTVHAVATGHGTSSLASLGTGTTGHEPTGNAESVSSKGGAPGSSAIPWFGILVLGVLGL